MSIIIHWKPLKISEWKQRFNRIQRANLLQCYEYGVAMAAFQNQRPRWGIIEIDGNEAGLVQILEVGLFKNLIHAVILDRGPLWFDGFDTAENLEAFLREFNAQFPRRLGRKRRFIPNINATSENEALLQRYGFSNTDHQQYDTVWIDLREGEEALRSQLKKNWRGSLQKAEKADIEIEWDDQGQHLSWLLQNYAVDKEEKGYDGPSVKLLQALVKTFMPENNMLIGRAVIDGEAVAGVMILCHGQSSTYQVGFSTKTGRDKAAHHILLWNALNMLQSKGIRDFDLGGVNDETAKGVKKFKTGMGGELVSTLGLYS